MPARSNLNLYSRINPDNLYRPMEEDFKKVISSLTEQIRKFLESCKAEGDMTIEDVLKRLEDLKKEA